MSVTNKPKIEAFIGSSGSGKGVSVNARLRELKPPRLLIWDPRDEYGKHAPGYDRLSYLVGAFKHAKGGPVRARYVPGAGVKLDEAFGIVCKLAFEAGNLVFVAEELSDVTTAGRAPAAWRQVITQGRHKGLHVIGAAQRPALIDKTFLGNCTYVRVFSLRYAEDRAAMCKALDLKKTAGKGTPTTEDLDALATVSDERGTLIRYIERDFSTVTPPRAGQIRLTK